MASGSEVLDLQCDYNQGTSLLVLILGSTELAPGTKKHTRGTIS